jgi:hypothetical protein
MEHWENQIVETLSNLTCDHCNELPDVTIKNGEAEINAECPVLQEKIYKKHFELYALHEAKIKKQGVLIIYRH